MRSRRDTETGLWVPVPLPLEMAQEHERDEIEFYHLCSPDAQQEIGGEQYLIDNTSDALMRKHLDVAQTVSDLKNDIDQIIRSKGGDWITADFSASVRRGGWPQGMEVTAQNMLDHARNGLRSLVDSYGLTDPFDPPIRNFDDWTNEMMVVFVRNDNKAFLAKLNGCVMYPVERFLCKD
jgi:hypothetical protein